MTGIGGLILEKVGGAVLDRIPDPKQRIEAEREIAIGAMELEKEVVGAQRDVIVADSSSDNWLTSSYRPIIALITCFPLLRATVTGDFTTIPSEVWQIQLAVLTGLVGTRGGEKIVREAVKAFRTK